jgi:hypothetical protein
MAIDAAIPLGVRPVQIDPTESIGKVIALRNALQQGQLGQERLKSEQLANQETQLKRRDDEILTKAWQSAGGDPSKTIEAAVSGGARPQAVQGLQKHFLDQANEAAKLSEADRAAQAAKADRLMGLITQAQQLPDDQYAQSFPQIIAAAKAIDPKDKTLAALSPDQVIPKDQLQHLQFGLVSHKAILDQAKELREQAGEKRAVDEFNVKFPGEQAKTAQARRTLAIQELSAAIDPNTGMPSNADLAALQQKYSDVMPGGSLDQTRIAQFIRSGVPIEKQPEFDINGMKAKMGVMGNSEYDQFLSRYAQSLGKTPATLTPQEGLDSFSKFAESKQDPVMRGLAIAQKNLAIALEQANLPSQETARNMADDILNHRLAPDQIATLRGRGNGALGRMIYDEAKKIDPSFNWEQASSEYNLARSQGFQNTVRYMDSVQESIPLVLDRAKKLANGNVRAISSLVNAGKNQFNDVDLKKFETDRALVADEIAKILQGGGTGSGTSDMKLRQAGEILKSTDSPAAIAGALGDVQQLIGYRRKALTRGTYLDKPEASSGGNAGGGSGADGHVIRLNGKLYQYNGSGATDDLKNYTEVKK